MRKAREFRKYLLKWFESNGRTFPWRKTRNPYRVLVAEKLLQQTSVRESLIGIYRSIVRSYPTPEDLSRADVTGLAESLQPLGLKYRANDLVLMARDIVESFGGKVPKTLDELLSIYGVGDYSARAVLSFAYGEDIPIVDTNVARILYRVYDLSGPFPQNPARKRILKEVAGELIPAGKSREFNWGMIDLGALVCRSSNPQCPICPLQRICDYASKA